MSIFGNIMGEIFGSGSAQAASAPTPTPTRADPTAAAPDPASTAPKQGVHVAVILDDLSGKAGQKLNWRTSIVDLMKLLALDSGLAARKELAKELNYSGDTNDSAAMNVWLHEQVMAKLAANGGKVPDDLR